MTEVLHHGLSVVIPAHGGSTRIPRKNLVDYRGKPLLLWAIEYALAEGWRPWVITDDAQIKAYALRCGALVLDEPAELAAVQISMPVMQWAARKLGSHVAELYPTTPIRRSGLITEAACLLESHDSVVAAAKLPVQFVLDARGRDVNGRALPDGTFPRSQDIADDPHYVQTGALYAMRFPHLLAETYETFGRVALLEDDFRTINDVDWPEDLVTPTVCVVGNASNIQERRLGWLIDEYDVVVRINWIQLSGWEAHVGTKTTHWALVCSPHTVAGFERGDYEGELRTDCSPFTAVWPRYGGHDGSYERCLSHLQHWRQLERICGWDDSIQSFARWNDDRQRLPTPTTGVVAIAKSIDKWGVRVDVAGFGRRDVLRRGHYGDRGSLHDGCHDLEAERLLLNDWEADGLIRRIDQ